MPVFFSVDMCRNLRDIRLQVAREIDLQIAFSKRLLETTTEEEKMMCNRKLTTSEPKVLILILFHCNRAKVKSFQLN